MAAQHPLGAKARPGGRPGERPVRRRGEQLHSLKAAAGDQPPAGQRERRGAETPATVMGGDPDDEAGAGRVGIELHGLELTDALVRVGLGDGEPESVHGRPNGGIGLDTASKLRTARWPRLPKCADEIRIVLVGDQHLRDVGLAAKRSAAGTPGGVGGGSENTGMSAADRIVIATMPEPAEIRYTVRRSPRARRIRVTVDAARGVQVVLPHRGTEREAAAAVQQLGPWIRRRVRELRSAQAAVAARGDTLPYLGDTLTLRPQRGRSRGDRRGEELLVPDGPERGAAVERWYRHAARTEIAARLDGACERAGLEYERLTIRGQRTRWASCSPTRSMSFNWRLLLAPEAVLDYVVWHEVCHLRVMDHSPRFWSELERWCPDYRAQKDWLRLHGQTLVL